MQTEAALRHNRRLLAAVTVTIRSGAAGQAVRITGRPEVPAVDPAREVIWRVEGRAARFDLAALLAKPAVAPGTALDPTNAAVQWVGAKRCLLARSTDTPSQFLFSADAEGAYAVAITVSSIDLEPWARRSNAAKIPAAKLPAAQGLTQAQVDARVRALEPSGTLVPGGAPADNGKVLKRRADGPAWGTVAYSELTGQPHGGGGVDELVNGPITGIRIANTNTSVPSRPDLTFTTPAIDLDDYRHGEFHVSITLTVTDPSVKTLGFGDEADTTYKLTDVIFAGTLRALPTFIAEGIIENEQIGDDVDLYNRSARLGTLRVYLGRDSQNRIGYLMTYSGIGAAAASLTVAATMRLSFSPTDAPEAIGTSKGPKVGEMVLTTTAAHTFPDGWVRTAWSELASDYGAKSHSEIHVPKTKELIGWMVKSLVNDVVIDTLTILKIAGPHPGSAGPVAAITFKNDVQSSLTIRFKWSSGRYHIVDVRGMDNEVPANAKLEIYEWV